MILLKFSFVDIRHSLILQRNKGSRNPGQSRSLISKCWAFFPVTASRSAARAMASRFQHLR